GGRRAAGWGGFSREPYPRQPSAARMHDSRRPVARLPAGFTSLLSQPILDLLPHRYCAFSKSTEEIAVLNTMYGVPESFCPELIRRVVVVLVSQAHGEYDVVRSPEWGAPIWTVNVPPVYIAVGTVHVRFQTFQFLGRCGRFRPLAASVLPVLVLFLCRYFSGRS